MNKPTAWKTPNRFAQDYRRALNAVSRQVRVAIGKETDPDAIVRKLQQISRHPPFQEYCLQAAYNMTTRMETRVSGTWRTAAQKVGRGSDIYAAIFAELKQNGTYDTFINQVHENARWIESFPREIAEEMVDYIQSEAMGGRRSSSVAEDLLTFFDDRTPAKMNLIARTETSKTQTALTQARAERLGLGWYIWRTSEDSRVRSSHDHMDGVLINWKNPPRPELLAGEENPPPAYHAGEIYNCRCYPEPVVDFDFLTFPVKVFYGGRIQRMTKAQFLKIAA